MTFLFTTLMLGMFSTPAPLPGAQGVPFTPRYTLDVPSWPAQTSGWSFWMGGTATLWEQERAVPVFDPFDQVSGWTPIAHVRTLFAFYPDLGLTWSQGPWTVILGYARRYTLDGEDRWRVYRPDYTIQEEGQRISRGALHHLRLASGYRWKEGPFYLALGVDMWRGGVHEEETLNGVLSLSRSYRWSGVTPVFSVSYALSDAVFSLSVEGGGDLSGDVPWRLPTRIQGVADLLSADLFPTVVHVAVTVERGERWDHQDLPQALEYALTLEQNVLDRFRFRLGGGARGTEGQWRGFLETALGYRSGFFHGWTAESGVRIEPLPTTYTSGEKIQMSRGTLFVGFSFQP